MEEETKQEEKETVGEKANIKAEESILDSLFNFELNIFGVEEAESKNEDWDFLPVLDSW